MSTASQTSRTFAPPRRRGSGLARRRFAKDNDDKLAKLHVIARLHTSVSQGWQGCERKNRFQLRLENKSAKPIVSLTAHIRFGCGSIATTAVVSDSEEMAS